MNSIISNVITLAAALLGFWSSSLIQKQRRKQSLVDLILGKRMTAYSEGLGFVYDVEQNQTNDKELERIYHEWKRWYPSHAVYLPPAVNDSFFEAMTWIVPVYIDLHNDKRVNDKTFGILKENLKTSKRLLMDLKDVGWLPEDLK